MSHSTTSAPKSITSSFTSTHSAAAIVKKRAKWGGKGGEGKGGGGSQKRKVAPPVLTIVTTSENGVTKRMPYNRLTSCNPFSFPLSPPSSGDIRSDGRRDRGVGGGGEDLEAWGGLGRATQCLRRGDEFENGRDEGRKNVAEKGRENGMFNETSGEGEVEVRRWGEWNLNEWNRDGYLGGKVHDSVFRFCDAMHKGDKVNDEDDNKVYSAQSNPSDYSKEFMPNRASNFTLGDRRLFELHSNAYNHNNHISNHISNDNNKDNNDSSLSYNHQNYENHLNSYHNRCYNANNYSCDNHKSSSSTRVQEQTSTSQIKSSAFQLPPTGAAFSSSPLLLSHPSAGHSAITPGVHNNINDSNHYSSNTSGNRGTNNDEERNEYTGIRLCDNLDPRNLRDKNQKMVPWLHIQ